MKLCSAPAKAMAQWRPIVCFSNRTEEILHRSGRPSRILRPAVDAVGRDMGAAGPGVGGRTRNTPKEGVERCYCTVSGLDQFHVVLTTQ